jgi:pimeloyl-ACP methyl ester carboxylesterase
MSNAIVDAIKPQNDSGLEIQLNQVLSIDGTIISYRSTGTGPAILLVPGALTLASDFDSFATELASRFTVHIIDRRGRGQSGPQGPDYGIDKECEDLHAVSSAIDAKFFFGHSFGGFVVLEYSKRHPDVEKAAVYEPGISIDGSVGMSWAQEFQGQLEQGRLGDAFITFIRGINPETTGKLPRWLLRIILWWFMKPEELERKYGLLSTIVPEHAEIARLDNTFLTYGEINARVMLLSGGDGERTATGRVVKSLLAVLGDATFTFFPTLDHFGPEKDPKQVAAVVAHFFQQ